MSEEILEALTDFATALEAAAVDFKQRVAKIVKVEPSLSEAPFLGLKWSKIESAKIKDLESTTKDANSGSDAFSRCMNILTANKAVINNRFHDKGWNFSYWLYANKPDTIYRQPKKS